MKQTNNKFRPKRTQLNLRRREFLQFAGASLGTMAFPAIIPSSAWAQAARTKIAVGGLVAAGCHAGGIEMARAKGIFEQQGLEVEHKQYNAGANLLQALSAGDVVAGVCGCNPTLLMRSQGVDVKILANSNLEGSALIVGPDIKEPKDLNGRKVATPGIAAIQDTLMRLYENKHGIRTEHAYVKVTDMPIMLANKEIAGYIVWEVAATAGLAFSGGRVLATSADIRANHECCALVASTKFLNDQPDVALRLVRSFALGLKQAVSNRDELVQVIANADHITPEQSKTALKHVMYKYPPVNDTGELAFIVKSLLDTKRIEANRVPDLDKFLADAVDNRMIRSVAV